MEDSRKKESILEFTPMHEYMSKEKKEKNKKEKIKYPEEMKNGPSMDIYFFETNKSLIPQRPYMIDGIIPKHPSRSIINAPSGSGKSQLMVNLFARPEMYGKDEKGKTYFDVIFIFSPTSDCDDLIKYLEIPAKRIFNEMDETILDNIINTQKEYINKYGGKDNPKALLKSPKVCIIFEDIQSDGHFMKSKSFKECFIMSRHYNMSIIMTSQSWTLTPRFARININHLFFFGCSLSEHELLIKEYTPPGLSKKEFEALVNYAITDTEDEKFCFLHVNKTKPFNERYRKKLKTILKLK